MILRTAVASSEKIRTINVASQFSRYPGGRFRTDGHYSAQRFRDDLLVPALFAVSEVRVELDGTLGYASSFLEEAFGGLVRVCGFRAEQLRKSLRLVTNSDVTPLIIWGYIDDADQAATQNHANAPSDK